MLVQQENIKVQEAMENFVFPDEIFKNDEKNWKHFSRPLKFWESAAGCIY